MGPIISLLTLVAQNSVRQQALFDALIKKGVVSMHEIAAEMPKTEAEAGRKFDKLKTEFFDLWSKFNREGK